MGSSSRSTVKTFNPYSTLPKPIQQVVKAWSNCKDCSLHKNKCQYVFYRGDAPCDVLFIGEAPGRDEDLAGLPFVGRSGQILESLIEDLRNEKIRFSYGVTNVVCCIPFKINEETGDTSLRPPNDEEANACRLRLLTTIQKARPSLICTLGKTALKYVRIPKAMMREYNLPRLELQHPAYIIRKGGKNSLEYRRNYLYLKDAIETLLHGKEIQRIQKEEAEIHQSH